MRPDYDYEKGLSLHLYQPIDGVVATCQVPSIDGSIVQRNTEGKTGDSGGREGIFSRIIERT